LPFYDIENPYSSGLLRGPRPPAGVCAPGFGQEAVVGHVLWLEALAADGAVGTSQVAWFPGQVALAEGEFDLIIEASLVAM